MTFQFMYLGPNFMYKHFIWAIASLFFSDLNFRIWVLQVVVGNGTCS